jgi:hypothetical protein
LSEGLRLRPWARRLAVASGIFACAALSACSSVSHVIADSWPRALGGLPEGVPPRPETPPAYQSVYDARAPRDNSALTAAERQRLEAEMAASRTQNTTQAEQAKNEKPARLPPIH